MTFGIDWDGYGWDARWQGTARTCAALTHMYKCVRVQRMRTVMQPASPCTCLLLTTAVLTGSAYTYSLHTAHM